MQTDTPYGALALLQTLAACGVELCLANPGTTELHLVRALDAVPAIRPVLGLFEGVCTGAADGYGRMTGKPAATLLHLGPGLANGIANLHNARRANTSILNLVGNHPASHLGNDAPLTSDIDALARNVSAWIKADSDAESLARDGADAYRAALRSQPGGVGRIATLIIGADAGAGTSSAPLPVRSPVPARRTVPAATLEGIARLLTSGGKHALLLDHQALTPGARAVAGRIAGKTGCRLLAAAFPARIESGAGQIAVERLPYFPEQVLELLAGIDHLILVAAQMPVSFFAYAGIPGVLVPPRCQVHRLAELDEDAEAALHDVAVALDAAASKVVSFEKRELARPQGELHTRAALQALAHTLPEHCIVATDSGAGNAAWALCQTAAPHTWLSLTGGSIGQGGPCATGAALACPERRVLALLGDGGAAYTNQCLWTQARENLDVTTVIFANRTYNILQVEYKRLGLTASGPASTALFNIGNPDVDWVTLAASMGVPGARATSAENFSTLLERSYRTPGPFLIEVV